MSSISRTPSCTTTATSPSSNSTSVSVSDSTTTLPSALPTLSGVERPALCTLYASMERRVGVGAVPAVEPL